MANSEESRGNWWIRLRYQDFFGSEACGEMNGDQQAFYLLMIAAAARAGERGLPSDQRALRKLLNVSLRLFRSSFPIVSGEFYEQSARLFHLVVDEELAKAKRRSNRARAAVHKRWRDRTIEGIDTSGNTEVDTTAIPSRAHPLALASSASLKKKAARSTPPEPIRVNPPGPGHDGSDNAQTGVKATLSRADGTRAESAGHDVENEARRLAGVWRELINPADPRGSAVRALTHCLMEETHPNDLEIVIQRRASEVKAEARGGDNPPQYQAGKFFRDPTVWRQYLGDDWQDPPSSVTGARTERDELIRAIREKGRVGASFASDEGLEGGAGVYRWDEMTLSELKGLAER